MLEDFQLHQPLVIKYTEISQINLYTKSTDDNIFCPSSNEECVKHFFDLFKPQVLRNSMEDEHNHLVGIKLPRKTQDIWWTQIADMPLRNRYSYNNFAKSEKAPYPNNISGEIIMGSSTNATPYWMQIV